MEVEEKEVKRKLKKSIRVRLRKEADRQVRDDNAGKLGAVKSSLRNTPTSPRKMRLVADMIRGQKASIALNILRFDDHKASQTIEKLLLTALSDWQNQNSDIDIENANLYVKEIYVDSARMLKRLRPAPQGRAHRIRKRSNHVTIVIDNIVGTEDNQNQENAK